MEKQSFRAGFLRGLAENGWTPDRLESAIAFRAKVAAYGLIAEDGMEVRAADISDNSNLFMNANWILPLLAGTAALAVPVGAGAAAGYGGAHLYHGVVDESDPTTIDDIKNNEIAKELELRKREIKNKLKTPGLQTSGASNLPGLA